ncbi:hypothetical protein [Catellatospora vulcania]|uniref:hypothetical protein n=1 Tax=Catellatospora vulcania TaxID=1460450 RepID=UPI0012D3CB2B|nr:hypothetical protein [Catellatospora vulcania]
MTVLQAAIWGVAGGAVAALVVLIADVVAAKFLWPYAAGTGRARMFVLVAQLLISGVVAAAAHQQISGPWPALLLGVTAPATIRAALANVEVTETTPQAEGGTGAS